jgi:hypothetical protein
MVMSVATKMTAIADKIRSLLGITGVMGLDAMASNLEEVEDEVDSQAELINQITNALEGKAGGSGGSIKTCTVVIDNDAGWNPDHSTIFASVANQNGESELFAIGSDVDRAPLNFPMTIESVVCGSLMCLNQYSSPITHIIGSVDNGTEYMSSFCDFFKVTDKPNVVTTITLADDSSFGGGMGGE